MVMLRLMLNGYTHAHTYHGDSMVMFILIVILVLNGYVQLFMVKGHVHA